MVSALCQAPRLPCPEALQARLGYSLPLSVICLPLMACPKRSQRLLDVPSKHPPRALESCGTAGQLIDFDTDAVALSSVCREVRATTKPGHALHHPCVQEDMQTDGLISHIPLPKLLMLEEKDDPGGQPEKPLKYVPKSSTQIMSHFNRGSAVRSTRKRCSVVWPRLLGTGPGFDPCKS